MDIVGENVLLIVLDSVRAKALSSYGRGRETFAKTQQFFETHGGRRYENAYAPSIWSLPSHVSMFTGAPVSEHGIVRNTQHLSEEANTVFSRMSDEGIHTGVFSSNPFLTDDEYNLQSQFDDDRTPDSDFGVNNRRDLIRENWAAPRGKNRISELKAWIAERDSQWAACLNLMDAHTPYIPKPTAYERPLDRLRMQYIHFDGELDRSEPVLRRMRNLYEGCVATEDALVSNLLKWLDTNTILDDTHVVVTADHGEAFGEPNVADRSTTSFHYDAVNDELLHIPLYERRPETTSFGTVNDIASVTNFPRAVRGGSFTQSPITASVLYGGNVTIDDKPWNDERARVVYRQNEDGIDKFVDDPRGVWSSTSQSANQIKQVVNDVFNSRSQNQSLAADSDSELDGDVEDRLSDLGYM